jgi:hypothetical protein
MSAAAVNKCLGMRIKHPRKCTLCGAKQGDHKVVLYPFPNNDDIRMEWVNFVRRVLPDFTLTNTNSQSRLCNGHFTPRCFKTLNTRW